MIQRPKDIQEINRRIEIYPVTAILGSRQVGKTTLARMIGGDHYFDLENPEDLIAFDNPSLVLNNLQGLIIIDEIQRKPELFPLLRYMTDHKPDQKYLILGSASPELIRQSSESLAGRISYYYLGGFTAGDVSENDIDKLWIRGGFPRSFLVKSDQGSYLWRTDFITTFLERDIPQLGITIPSRTLRRFWMMLTHYNGQIMNYSEIAKSFGISDMTVRHYLDILEGTFMIRQRS